MSDQIYFSELLPNEQLELKLEKGIHSKSIAVKEIKEAQRLFINYAYYLGVLPAYMDGETLTAHHVTSFPKLCAYKVVISFLILHKLVIACGYCIGLINGTVNMAKPIDLMHGYMALMFLFTGGLHLHTVWKSKELVALINSANQYFARFEELFGPRSGPKKRNLYGKVMKWYFYGCLALHVTTVVAFLTRCEMHYHHKIYEVCQVDTKGSTATGEIHWKHKDSIPYLILLSIVQYFGLADQITSACVYFAFAIPTILTGLQMQTALRHTQIGSYLNSHRNWVRHYRNTQVLVTQVNECVRDFMMPYHIACAITFIIFTNYIIISYDLEISVRVSWGVTNCILIGFIIVLFGQGGNIKVITQKALALRKTMVKQSKLAKIELNSLRTMKIEIGSLCYLDEKSRLMAYWLIVNYTADVLLTFR